MARVQGSSVRAERAGGSHLMVEHLSRLSSEAVSRRALLSGTNGVCTCIVDMTSTTIEQRPTVVTL